MGGREGAWGYLSQAVVSVINSLSDDSWTHVQIEPDTNNDKVDIAWFYEGENIEAVQVKSSKNNFPLPDILSWLDTLIQDVPDASGYRLILIGTCSDTTKKTFNRINENRATSEDWKENMLLQENADKINIQLENNDHEALESKIMRYLGQFLSNHKKYPSHLLLELMSNSLGYQFMRFSTNGEKISKENFEKQLLEWVEFNYLLEGKILKSDLRIEYYLSNAIPFSTEINSFQYELLHSKFIYERKREAIELFQKINQINIPVKTREEPKEIELLGRMIKATNPVYCEFRGERREELKELSERILETQLRDDFFYVGNLYEPSVKVELMFGSSQTKRTGDELEKEKFELILNFERKLEDLNSYINMFSYLDSFLVVPLVLRNIGTKYDEKIRVKLLFPKEVSILSDDTFEIPEISIIENFTGYEGILDKILTHKKDSIIEEFHYSPSVPGYPFDSAFLDAERRRQIKIDNFTSYLGRLFHFEVFWEGDNTALIFHFNEINPKETLAFPCFILCRSEQSFIINYEITSKNLTEVAIGKVHYRI